MAADMKSLQSRSSRLEEELVEERRVSAENMDRISSEMATRASEIALEEVHERVDYLCEAIREDRQNGDSVSRVPETEAHTSRAASVVPVVNESPSYAKYHLSHSRYADSDTESEEIDGLSVHQNASMLIPTSQESMPRDVLLDTQAAVLSHNYPQISNIRHEATVPKLQQNLPPETILQAPQSIIHTADPTTTKVLNQDLPKPLGQLLSLKQTTQLNLVDYFNVLADIAPAGPYNEEVQEIYLRRFIHGVEEFAERTFIQTWLQSGQLSLQNIRDAVVLLQKWPISNSPPQKNLSGNDLSAIDLIAGVEKYTAQKNSVDKDQIHRQQAAKPLVRLKPNVTTRAAAAAIANHQRGTIEADTINLTPRQTAKTGSGVLERGSMSKSSRKSTRKPQRADATYKAVPDQGEIQNIKLLRNGKKRPRQDYVNSLRGELRTPNNRDQTAEDAGRRKRTKTPLDFGNTTPDYPSSPPVNVLVPQSSPLQEVRKRRDLKPHGLKYGTMRRTYLQEANRVN